MSKLKKIAEELRYRAAHRQEAIWMDVAELAEEALQVENDLGELFTIVERLVQMNRNERVRVLPYNETLLFEEKLAAMKNRHS